MGKDNFITQTMLNILENLLMVKKVEEEYIYTLLEIVMMENGKPIKGMVLELCILQMEINMKENEVMDRKMERECIHLPKEIYMRVTGWMVNDLVEEFMSGIITKNILVNGDMIR